MSLSGHAQLQHEERQQRQSQQQHASPRQHRSPHHQFYQSGPSPDFEGASPTRNQLNQPSDTPQKGDGGDSSRRESETHEWGLTKAGKKRQRLPLACQVCRKKKIRCSGEQPICKHCLRFSLPCVYKTTTSRRPRNSLRKQSASGGDGRRGSALENQSASPSPPPQASLSQNRPQTMQPIPTQHSLMSASNFLYDPFERQEVPAAPTFLHPSAFPDRPSAPVHSITGPASVTLSMQSDILDQSSRQNSASKPFDITPQIRDRLPAVRGQPATNPPAPTIFDVPSPTSSLRSTKIDAHTPLPPRTVLLKLVEIYFTHVNNQTYGFLHRPTFLRHIEEGKVPDGLLYSMCAISARFSPKHVPPSLPRQSTKEKPAYHAGEPYAIEARKLALREFDKPSIENVQTFLLLALHDFGCKKGQKAWMFAGMAIRMATALRLNREVDGDAIGAENISGEESRLSQRVQESRASYREKLSWTEREIRRRTFWACFIVDRLNSTGMERPHVIQESDCYVQLPTAERSFMFSIPIKTEHLTPAPLSSDTPTLSPLTHSMGSEAYLVRIVALWGRVTKYINQGGRLHDVNPPWTPESGFATLNSELQEWIDRLPYWLRYSSSNLADQVAISQAPGFVFMHVTYHMIGCTLHRFSAPSANRAAESQREKLPLPSWEPPPDFLQNSVKTCFEHAKAISTITAEVISRSDCIVTAPFLGYAVFTANLFHLHQTFTPCPCVDETPEMAREFFATGVTLLNELRIWWGPLEMLSEGLRILWETKARNSHLQITNETTSQTVTTAQAFEEELQHSFPGNTMVANRSTPRPIWMSSQSYSPGRAEHFDMTGLIPLPGGNFGLDFIDPNLHSSINGDNFGNTMFDNTPLEAWTGDWQYRLWGDESTAMFSSALDSNLQAAPGDGGKIPASSSITYGRPLSPFSNALYGFGRSRGRNDESSPVMIKKEESDEHKSVFEQIHKGENSVIPPPNLTSRGLTESTPGVALGLSGVSPASGTSGQAGIPGWGTSSSGNLQNTSAKSPNDDKGEEVSEEEEAADLLVYFHARSGGSESIAVDDSNEGPGDEPLPTPTISGSRVSLYPAVEAREMLRKRKRHETDYDFTQLTSSPVGQSRTQSASIEGGNIFPGKSDGTGTAKEVAKGLYLEQALPTGSMDLLNILRQSPEHNN